MRVLQLHMWETTAQPRFVPYRNVTGFTVTSVVTYSETDSVYFNDASLKIMLESYIFRQISAKLVPKTKQHYCGYLVSDGEFSKRLFSTISEQDLTQNVGEVAYSIYLAVCWPTAQNVRTWVRNKDKIYTYPYFLWYRDNGDEQIQNKFIPWLQHFATVFLSWIVWFGIHLIYLNLNKPTMQQCFHPSAKHLLYRYITPSFVGHSFRVKGETLYFFAN